MRLWRGEPIEHQRRRISQGTEFFGFVPTAELPGGYCSRVWTDGVRVLKVPFQDEEQTTGRLAAERMSGWPGVRILDSDPASGSLLMDQLGESLASVWRPERDDEAIDVFLELAMAMRRISPIDMMGLGEYVGTGGALAATLLESTTAPTFLHGDLHHENVLRDTKLGGWLAIDPKGLSGDPAYEAVVYMRNPMGRMQDVVDMKALLRHRLDRLGEGLEVAPARIWAWSLVDLRGDALEPGSDRYRIRAALESLTEYRLTEYTLE